MSDSASTWADSARRTLAEAGHRAGGARDAVVDLMDRQDCCLSAQEAAAELSGKGSKAGRASVYRALDLLHGLGLVQRVDLGDGEVRFEPVRAGGEHHHHAVCDSCGTVTPFEDPKLEADLHRIGDRLGHTIDEHDVVIHGTCGRCEAA